MIKTGIIKILSQFGDGFTVEHPTDPLHGDFSTNIALVLGKRQGKNPQELAELIKQKIMTQKPDWLERAEVAGPGFINFHLTRQFFAAEVAQALAAGFDYGRAKPRAGEKVIIEYTDPNPFKEFHIGHLMSNTIGEAISRLVEWQGAEVRRANYQGDVGLHVAKALWGKQRVPGATWGQAYAAGSEAYESDEKVKQEVGRLNQNIYDRTDQPTNDLYDEGRAATLAEFEKIYDRLGTKFDFYFFESEAGPRGRQIVEANLGKVFENSDGAIVFRGEKFDPQLHTRVFITKEGLPTYEAKELALPALKSEKFSHDQSIVITGNEVVDYFRVVTEALRQIDPASANKTVHRPHGMLRLAGGKMSSRQGNVISAQNLIDQIKREVNRDDESIAESVAIGAIKYAVLRQSLGNDIIFDFKKSLSLEGDSGPYLQYAAVRARAVLKKAETEKIKPSLVTLPQANYKLERLIYQFPEAADRSANDLSPHHLTTYLTALAAEFNSFYGAEKIIDSTDTHSSYKLALTKAALTVLERGLNLLAMPVPQKM